MTTLTDNERKLADYIIRGVDFATPNTTGTTHEDGGYFVKWRGATVAVVFHEVELILFAPFDHELFGTEWIGSVLDAVAEQQFWEVQQCEYDFEFKETVRDCQDLLKGV